MYYRNLFRFTLLAAAALPLAAQLPKPPAPPGLPRPPDPIELVRKLVKLAPARLAALRPQVKAPDIDLPGVMWVAQQAHVSPEAVMQTRLGGLSWMDIFVKFRVPLERVVIVAEDARCGPFERAWIWRGGRGRPGRRAERPAPRPEFSDGEIADFIKLRAVSQAYGEPLNAVALRFCGGHPIQEIIDEEDHEHHDDDGDNNDEHDHHHGHKNKEKGKKHHQDDDHHENHGEEHGEH